MPAQVNQPALSDLQQAGRELHAAVVKLINPIRARHLPGSDGDEIYGQTIDGVEVQCNFRTGVSYARTGSIGESDGFSITMTGESPISVYINQTNYRFDAGIDQKDVASATEAARKVLTRLVA